MTDRKDIGEGSYEGSRDYHERTEAFLAKKGKDVENLARKAEEALDGEEGESLKEAEQEGRSHAKS